MVTIPPPLAIPSSACTRLYLEPSPHGSRTAIGAHPGAVVSFVRLTGLTTCPTVTWDLSRATSWAILVRDGTRRSMQMLRWCLVERLLSGQRGSSVVASEAGCIYSWLCTREDVEQFDSVMERRPIDRSSPQNEGTRRFRSPCSLSWRHGRCCWQRTASPLPCTRLQQHHGRLEDDSPGGEVRSCCLPSCCLGSTVL